MWPFRSIILALAIALTNTLPLDSPSPLPELENGGVHWAVIVAGSNGWYNYRHQADVCHAYQILHKHGIPDERIVVMMYDDIAYNEQNPHKGVIINQVNGTDVYKGVPKDYTGSAVSPDVFLKVLQGNKAGLDKVGSGKVINSGPNDNIFLFIADYGAPGLIAFPDDYLYASTFLRALTTMYNEKKYAKMLIYIEACESGSMIRNLRKDINIFAVSSSKGNEVSYACCYDVELNNYVGDVFSVNWMELSDEVPLYIITVLDEYEYVKFQVNPSHVQKFGDMSIGEMTLNNFQDSKYPLPPLRNNSTIPNAIFDSIRKKKLSDLQASESGLQSPGNNHAIPGLFDFFIPISYRKVALRILINQWEKAITQQEIKYIERKIYEYIEESDKIRGLFRYIVEIIVHENEMVEMILNTLEEITDTKCYEEVVEHFRYVCSRYIQSEFVLEHLNAFVNLCNQKYYIWHITDAINRACLLYTEQ